MGALMEGGVGKGVEVTTEETAQAANEERWIHGQHLPKTFEASLALFYSHTGGVNRIFRLLLFALPGEGGGIHTNNICQKIRASGLRARRGCSGPVPVLVVGSSRALC